MVSDDFASFFLLGTGYLFDRCARFVGRLTVELCSHLMLRSGADHRMAAQHNMQALNASAKTTSCVRATSKLTTGTRMHVMLREFAA